MGAPGEAVAPDLAVIESQLAELWRGAAAEGQAVVRACSHNLVVVCADADDLEEATRLVARVSETEPARALVFAPAPGAVAPGGLEVFVSAHCHRGAGEALVCCEQVTLKASAEGLPLVPGTILQLLVGDLPVHTVWRRSGVAADALLPALCDLSDRLIVTSADFRDPIPRLRELHTLAARDSWRGQVADVTWGRLEPWCEALASFFDAPALRCHLSKIRRLTVTSNGPTSGTGLTSAGAYLAGWLASRLGWRPGRRTGEWKRPDGGSVTCGFELTEDAPAGEVSGVRIEAEEGGDRVTFIAERVAAQSRFVRLSVESQASGPLPRKIRLPARDGIALLCGVIQRSDRDLLYERALECAARMGRAG